MDWPAFILTFGLCLLVFCVFGNIFQWLDNQQTGTRPKTYWGTGVLVSLAMIVIGSATL